MKQGASADSRNKEGCPPSTPNSCLVRIDSIYINIDAAEQMKPNKCEHFTIRGYVSDNRKPNGKLCWPFAICGDDCSSSENVNSWLYPLQSPQFRRWCCQSCLREIDAAEILKDDDKFTANGSRQLKTKCSRSHRTLENVVAYLSEKLKQPLEMGHTQCKGAKSALVITRKRPPDSALHSNTRGLGKTELCSATTSFISNHQYQYELHKHLLRPSGKIASTKLHAVDSAKHQRRNAAGTKLVPNHQQHDGSIGTGHRKTKTKKLRLLDEILNKDDKGAKHAVTDGFHTDESAKGNISAAQSMRQSQINKVRCYTGQKRIQKCQFQDNRRSTVHNSLDGNDERKRAQEIKGAFAYAERHVRTEEGHSDSTIKQYDKMVLGHEPGADWHKCYYDRDQKTKNDSFIGREHMSTCQPFHGTVTDSLQNSSISSQVKGKYKDTTNKEHQAIFLSPIDNGKELDKNTAPHELTEKILIDHLTQSFQTTQEEYSSKRHYLFSDGCLDTGKGITYWVPGTGNGNLINGTAMQHVRESRSACKFLASKKFCQGAYSNSGFKRLNQGTCVGRKKPKHITRTEGGPTVVHRTEFLLTHGNKMGGTSENPEIISEFRGNMMQETRTSDDIPMEIVELMAKNQYEGHLHEVGKTHDVMQPGSNQKNDLVCSRIMLPDLVSRAVLHEKLHLPNAYVISGNDSGFSNRKLDFSSGKPNGYIMDRPTGSTCTPILSSHPELSSVSAASSGRTDVYRNCKYDMNRSASEQRVSSRPQSLYEAWQPTSQKRGKRACVWPMLPPNNSVQLPSFLLGNGLQPFKIGEVPECSSYDMDVRDTEHARPADFGNGANNIRLETSHTPWPNKVNSQQHVTGSPDPYATIPAMHLLSLMNDHTKPNTPKNMDAIASRKTFDRSFSNAHLAKELSGCSFVVSKSSHKVKQPSVYGYHNKNLQTDPSCKCSPPAPIFGTVVGSLHGDIGNKRGIQLQPSSQQRDRAVLNVHAGGSILSIENRGSKYQKSQLTNTGGVAFEKLIPVHELESHVFIPSWSGFGSSHLYMNWVAPESYENRRPEPGFCCFNRNPIEFTMPGPGNEYMISSEDLKLRKAYPLNIDYWANGHKFIPAPDVHKVHYP